MKKYHSILMAVMLALLAFAVVACDGGDGDDDKDSGIDASLILGSWQCFDEEHIGEDFEYGKIEMFEFFSELNMYSDGNCSYTFVGGWAKCKFKYDGGKLTFYNLSNGNGGYYQPKTYKITKLTKDLMVLSFVHPKGEIIFYFGRKYGTVV